MIQTIIYLLDTGAVDHSTTAPVEDVERYINKEKFGALEVDPDATIPVVANGLVDGSRTYVANSVLRVRDPLPNIPILKDRRAQFLAQVDWMTTRHRDQKDKGGPTTLTEEQYLQLLDYKQALRDWPVSGDYNEAFPVKPPFV